MHGCQLQVARAFSFQVGGESTLGKKEGNDVYGGSEDKEDDGDMGDSGEGGEDENEIEAEDKLGLKQRIHVLCISKACMACEVHVLTKNTPFYYIHAQD